MAKTYRSAKGNSVDIHRLLSENEDVRAIGNMNVNARGDVIDSENNQVESRNTRVNKQYRRQIGNVVEDIPVSASKRRKKKAASKPTPPVTKIEEPVIEDIVPLAEDNLVVEDLPVTEEAPVIVKPEPAETKSASKPAKKAKGGLAAAIAKAKEVKQEPLKSPRQQARESQGVKKI
jgi:hypothetical protein